MHKSLKSTIFEVFGFENVHATLYTLEVGAMYRLKWVFFWKLITRQDESI